MTAAELLRRLHATGVIPSRAVVEGRVAATGIQARHASYVVRGAAGAIFVKTPRDDVSDARATLAREAAIYATLAQDDRWAALRPHVTTLVAWYAEPCVLCLRLVDEAGPAADWLGSPVAALQLGALLGDLHGSPAPPDAAPIVPAIFSVVTPTPDAFASLSAANVELCTALAANEAALAALAATEGRLRATSFVHGDLKPAHVLRRGAPGREELVLVDWEHAGPGDPAWDVAGVLHAPLVDWAGSAAPDPRGDPRPTLELRDLTRHVPLFWRRYRDATRADGDLLERVRLLTGARLIQTAFEANADRSAMSYRAAQVAQLGVNVLTTGDALGRLVGITA